MDKNLDKKEKEIKFSYQVLNLKLLSNERKGDEAYQNIIETIYNKSIKEIIPRGKVVIIRNQFKKVIKGKTILYGKISRFSNRESDDWINLSTKEIEHPKFDPNLFPNLQETDYVFVPSAHRFIIKKTPNFSIYNAEDFFNKAILEVIDNKEDYTVIVEQSIDIFEEIYNARSVEKLNISISYTNSDDISEDAAAWMDEQLKSAQLKKANFSFEANQTDSINLETPLIKGALDLAAENGEATATIVDNFDKKIKVVTREHPKVITTTAKNEDEIKNVIFTEVMKQYRNNGNNEQ